MKIPGAPTASEFAGKTVVVTGACGIYGTWIAEAFAKVGAHVCLTDRRDTPLELTLREIDASARSYCVAADLSRDDDLEALTARISAEWGRRTSSSITRASIRPGSCWISRRRTGTAS